MKVEVKRCTRCILPESMPNISFDKKGVCNYCKTYQKYEYSGEQALLNSLEKHRNASKKYDCMVTISGGRDSAYALLKMKKDYDMRVLAVNYENPFTDDQGKRNVENMVKILGVDHTKFKHASSIHRSCFRNNLIAWFGQPSPAMVPMMCIGCKLIWKKIIRIAKAYDISLVVSGGNPLEYTSFKKELLTVSRDVDLTTYYVQYVRGLIKESLKNLAYIKPQYVPTLLKGYLFAHQYAMGPRLFAPDIEKIDIFHFIRWDEKEVISRISNELNWDYPRKFHSTWRFDCKISHLKDYMYMKTLGVTEKDDFYAKTVREGLLTREQALKRLPYENQLHLDTIEEIFNISKIPTTLLQQFAVTP